MSISARLGTPLALAGTVLAGVVLWGSLGQQLDVPTVFGDELIHWDASRSLAEGDGLQVRDGDYGFGPVYPALLAPVHWIADTDLSAYRWARLLNAVLFALAAVPAFLLARRLLDRRWSLACAALAIIIPSALYTGFVMTEGAAYLASTLALYLCARCVERATVASQLLALGSLALATAVRLQLGALIVAFAAALGVRWLISRGARLPTGVDVVRLWPLLVVLGVAAAAAVTRAALGNPLAGYAVLWHSYDPLDVALWTWRALGGLGLYLALVPLVLLPSVLASLAREGRRGSSAAAAFVALFATVNAALLVVVGAFSTTEFGIGFLHDRYLFYVVPLWLVAVAVWAKRRVPLEPVPTAVGGILVVALLATLPPSLLKGEGVDALAAQLPSRIAQHVGRAEPSRWWLGAAAILAIVTVLALARLPRWLVIVPVAVVFGLNAGLAWDARIDSARNTTFARMDARSTSWVDEAVPGDADVAMLWGGVPVEVRDALRLTEFFNGSIGPAYELAGGYAPTLAATRVRVGANGVVLATSGPLRPLWVVAPRGLGLDGEVVAVGTDERLRLWRTRLPLRVVTNAAASGS